MGAQMSTTFAPVAQLDRVFGYEPKGQGFESLLARQNDSNAFALLSFFRINRDSNPERVSDVKKTVLWTVFSREVRSGYDARTEYAFGGFVPSGAPQKSTLRGAFLNDAALSG